MTVVRIAKASLLSFQSIWISHGVNASPCMLESSYSDSSLFLRSFNDEYSKGNKSEKDVPKIRFNGHLPVRCTKQYDRGFYDGKEHGYTYQRLYQCCYQLKNICCSASFGMCPSGCGRITTEVSNRSFH
jgi:hypothetical protein